MWDNTGQTRPAFAVEPGPGQESVWDYPRPPVMQPWSRLVVVSFAEQQLASTSDSIRLLETASPPGVYLPFSDIRWSALQLLPCNSFCEWKGVAQYWSLSQDENGVPVAWSYPEPNPAFAGLRHYLSFYPGRVQCSVDGVPVAPQDGDFYGGWITPELVGPFKGEPGTGHW